MVLCLLVITFPGDFQAVGPGLDPSWIYALNYLPHTGVVFGRDFAHTFGPLGYLLVPLDIGPNLLHATAFRLAIHAIFASCLFYYALSATSLMPMALFFVGYVISTVAVVTLEFSYQLLIVLVLLFCVSLKAGRWWPLPAATTGVLSASLLYIKFGIGVAAFTILATATVLWIVTKVRPAWMILLVVLGSYLGTMAAIAAIFLQSPQNFLLWIGGSLDMSDGFSIAQSKAGPSAFVLSALLCLAIYSILTFMLFRQRSGLRYIAPVFALALFLAFKHGFVRLDAHVRNFYPFLLASLSLLALNVTTRGEIRPILVSYAMVLALAIPVGASYLGDPAPIYEKVIGKTGLSNLVSTLDLESKRTSLAREGRQNLDARPLPAAWLREIRENHWTIDVIPWELSYALANDLRWVPNVTLQLFMTYTPFLDRWNAQHFLGGNAPDVLLVEFRAVDGRNILLDSPAVTRSLLRNYRIEHEDLEQNLTLLRKRTRPLETDSIVFGDSAVSIGDWIDVPRSDRLVFADLEMSLSLVGRAMKTLFRVPPVYIEMIYESGSRATFRITPEVARDGLLINFLPSDKYQFSQFLNGQAKYRVVAFRINGPGVAYYGPTSKLRWSRANLPLPD